MPNHPSYEAALRALVNLGFRVMEQRVGRVFVVKHITHPAKQDGVTIKFLVQAAHFGRTSEEDIQRATRLVGTMWNAALDGSLSAAEYDAYIQSLPVSEISPLFVEVFMKESRRRRRRKSRS